MKWEKVKLGEVIDEAQSGFASGQREETGLAQVRMNNVTREGKLVWNDVRRVPEPKNVHRFLLQPGDVLFNSTNSPNLVGKSALFSGFGEPISFSNHFLRLRSNSAKLESSFLLRWLVGEFQRGTFEGLCTQWVNQASVRREDLLNLEIPLPPLAEQQRIAAILDHADALRRARRQSLKRLDELAAALFLETFGDPATNPKGWKIVPVKEACDLVVDCVNKTAPLAEQKTAFKMLRTTNVRNGAVDMDNVRYVDEETFKKWTRRAAVEIDDIIFTREAPLGEVGRIANKDNVFLGQRLMMYRVNRKLMTPYFLVSLLLQPSFKAELEKYGTGSTVKHLSVPTCEQLTIPLPPLSLQTQFAEQIEVLEAIKTRARQSLTELDALFASLQERAFNGEL